LDVALDSSLLRVRLDRFWFIQFRPDSSLSTGYCWRFPHLKLQSCLANVQLAYKVWPLDGRRVIFQFIQRSF